MSIDDFSYAETIAICKTIVQFKPFKKVTSKLSLLMTWIHTAVPPAARCIFWFTLRYLLCYTRFFKKNNFIRTTRLKFSKKLRTSYKEQLRLGFSCKCNCMFLLKNTTQCCMRVTVICWAKLCFSILNFLPAGGKTLFG